MRRILEHVDRFVAPSAFLANLLERWGIPRSKLIVYDYGTAELEYANVTHQTDVEPLFGFIGGVTPEKGVDLLLEAFRDLKGARLVLYGTDRPTLQRLFTSHHDVLNQPNVTVLGRIDERQKLTAIPSLDALIVPSVWYENSPIVIHEAFQAGVPVVCSNIGGMSELVTDGVDGLHFKAANAESLRDVITRCVKDPNLLRRLHGNVRKPKTMTNHVLKEILPLYKQVVNGGTASGASHVD
jgi:glycosyltransferase involved in cell wall biosynthesis